MILITTYRTAPCPTPSKQRYANEAEAYVGADFIFDEQGATLEPYACSCGLWHLTAPLGLKGKQTIVPPTPHLRHTGTRYPPPGRAVRKKK